MNSDAPFYIPKGMDVGSAYIQRIFAIARSQRVIKNNLIRTLVRYGNWEGDPLTNNNAKFKELRVWDRDKPQTDNYGDPIEYNGYHKVKLCEMFGIEIGSLPSDIDVAWGLTEIDIDEWYLSLGSEAEPTSVEIDSVVNRFKSEASKAKWNITKVRTKLYSRGCPFGSECETVYENGSFSPTYYKISYIVGYELVDTNNPLMNGSLDVVRSCVLANNPKQNGTYNVSDSQAQSFVEDYIRNGTYNIGDTDSDAIDEYENYYNVAWDAYLIQEGMTPAGTLEPTLQELYDMSYKNFNTLFTSRLELHNNEEGFVKSLSMFLDFASVVSAMMGTPADFKEFMKFVSRGQLIKSLAMKSVGDFYDDLDATLSEAKNDDIHAQTISQELDITKQIDSIFPHQEIEAFMNPDARLNGSLI